MYHKAIFQCIRALDAVDMFLDKAELYAEAKKFDIDLLLASRLAPDMKPFIYQVQSACDYLKGGAAWLSGQLPPKHEDDEKTLQEVRARIHKTVAFAQGVTARQYERAGEREVKLSWVADQIIKGDNYLFEIVIPNVYFHVAMAYAILRHNGVDVGKMDFLGPISFVHPDQSDANALPTPSQQS
jgi:hypothetical protein